jgi:hypothetical protein
MFSSCSKKFIWSLQIGISFLLGLLVQLFKKFVHSPRPEVFFRPDATIVPWNSRFDTFFPCQYATTIFAFTTLLSFYFLTENQVYFYPHCRSDWFFRIICLTIFLLMCGGSVFGVLISLLTYRSFQSKDAEKISGIRVRFPTINCSSTSFELLSKPG